MAGIGRPTLFMLGDSQVGKTTIVNRVFSNHELIFVGETSDATEYHVYLEGRDIPIKTLEIRNSAFLTENEIEIDDRRDVVLFCYAVDDPESFQHVTDRWIPLFEQHVGNTVTMVLIENKKDLQYDPEVIDDLAVRGLQPVSMYQGHELFCSQDKIHSFFVMGNDYFQRLEELKNVINNHLLNYN
ncbi:unnamed protein product [Larinioides sclopetarius]|uniref:Uncharacterized protein n=1 Tax=Larinioides sclopetarius TaxID=280406 RepID=A0AAV2BDB4_9ARAC